MKKRILKSIIFCIMIFVLLGIMPHLFNCTIEKINQNPRFNFPFIDLCNWYDIMSVAIPSILTYLVIMQSDRQQAENYNLQDKMEKISARMLELELRNDIGYLRPYFKLKDAGFEGTFRQPYPYELSKKIVLVNSGEADLFIISASFIVDGNQYVTSLDSPFFISKQSPFNEFHLETNCLSDELDCPQIDMTIELVLKSIKGFQYRQILFLGFENREKLATVNKFNFEIQEMN